MKTAFASCFIFLIVSATGCRTTGEESEVKNLRPPQDNNSPSGDIVGPSGACTADKNEYGFPSACGCPTDYMYSSIIGKCTLSTRICSKSLVPMFHPATGKCLVVGDGCAASDLITTGWRRQDSNDNCSGQPTTAGGKVSGFDFTGLKTLNRAPMNQVCPAVVNAEEEACQRAGGTGHAAAGCAVLCSQPIAKKGKVAGYNFAGPRIGSAMPANTFCPQVVSAETDACLDVGGDTTTEKGCKTICNRPIAKKGKVAGFDFTGFKTADSLAANMACPQVANALTDACIDAGGDTTYTKGCGTLCSVPVAK